MVPSADGHFLFGFGVPFILAWPLGNITKNTVGPLCLWLHTPHAVSRTGGHVYRACLEYYDFCCTLKRLNSLRIESRDMAKLVKIIWLKSQGLSLSVDRELEVP